jgi:hypothetical protein
MSKSPRGTAEAEEHLAAFAVVSAQLAASAIASGVAGHHRELRAALWPRGGTPDFKTWDVLIDRARAHAQEKKLEEMTALLDQLGPSMMDGMLRQDVNDQYDRLEDLVSASARMLLRLADGVVRQKDLDQRWNVTRLVALAVHDTLLRAHALISLVPDAEPVRAPLGRMLAKASTLLAHTVRPDELTAPDTAATRDFWRTAAEQRDEIAHRLGLTAEAHRRRERSPEETLARIEIVCEQLTAIAKPLGAHVDEVLFGGPQDETTCGRLTGVLDEALSEGTPTASLRARSAKLDAALLEVSPPGRGTESVLVRAVDRLAVAAETLRNADPDDEASVQLETEDLLRSIAAHTVMIAAGTNAPEHATRLLQVLEVRTSARPDPGEG